MKLPWSGKRVDLEPKTGDRAQDETAIERKLGLSKVGTYVDQGVVLRSSVICDLFLIQSRIFASGASLFSDGYAAVDILTRSSSKSG